MDTVAPPPTPPARFYTPAGTEVPALTLDMYRVRQRNARGPRLQLCPSSTPLPYGESHRYHTAERSNSVLSEQFLRPLSSYRMHPRTYDRPSSKQMQDARHARKSCEIRYGNGGEASTGDAMTAS